MKKHGFYMILMACSLLAAAHAQTSKPNLSINNTNAPAATATVLSEPGLPPTIVIPPDPGTPSKALKRKPKAPTNLILGKLTAIDRTNLVMTIETKGGKSTACFITSQTRLFKEGKPSTFSDATLGDSVQCVFAKSKDGKLNAVTVEFGTALKNSSQPTPTQIPKKKTKISELPPAQPPVIIPPQELPPIAPPLNP